MQSRGIVASEIEITETSHEKNNQNRDEKIIKTSFLS
jgi:hypothetical protein